jgi:hypothetical protein
MGAPEQTGVYYGCTNLQSEPIRSLCIFIRHTNLLGEMKPQPLIKRIVSIKKVSFSTVLNTRY